MTNHVSLNLLFQTAAFFLEWILVFAWKSYIYFPHSLFLYLHFISIFLSPMALQNGFE